MTCPKCGLQLPEHACFCAACGFEIQQQKKKKIKKLFYIIMSILLMAACLFGIWNFGKDGKQIDKSDLSQKQSILFKDGKGTANEQGKDEIVEQEQSQTAKTKEIQVSQYGMNIQESDGYLYFKYVTDLVRMPLTGSKLENVIAFSEVVKIGSDSLQVSFSSFAILGNDIYFGMTPIEMGDGYGTGYFRVPKTGGNAEFLFVMPESNLVIEDEKLYFLFQDNSAYGVYNPKADVLPKVTKLKDAPACEEGELAPFSVSDGYLYYLGIRQEGNSAKDVNFYKTKIETGESEVLLDSSKVVTEGIKNVVFTKDAIFYTANFHDIATLVKKYDILTEKQSIIHGFKGRDEFIALDQQSLLAANSENAEYTRFSIDTNEVKEAVYQGAESQGTDEFASMVNEQFGIEKKEESSTQVKREHIEAYVSGYFIAANEMHVLDSGESFNWYNQTERPEAIAIQKEEALTQAQAIWMQSKGLDITAGIAADGTMGSINQ